MNTPLRVSLCLLLAGFWLAAASSPARGAVAEGLYEARVPVADQSAAQRSAALQQAFAAVLLKVTGTRAAGTLVSVLGSPSQYVQQYRYEKLPPDPSVPATQPTAAPSLLLWARFDATVVDNALHAAHAPQWGAERPRTLVWLALADAPGGRILAATDNSYLMQALATAAQQRGVSFVFPQMDGPDKSAIGVPDLMRFNTDRIRQASQRYKVDAVLVGSVAPFGTGQFNAHWQLISADRIETWDTPAGDEVLVAVDGVQTSADRFAAHYAIAPGAGDLTGVPLQVDGVISLDAYAKVLSYLGTLTPVRAVRVERVAQGSVYFSLDIHGSVDNLESAVVLGGMMTAPAAVAAPPAPSSAPVQGALPAMPLRFDYTPGP